MYFGTEVHFNVKCDEMAHWPNSDDVHVHHVVCYTMQELFPFFKISKVKTTYYS